MRIGVVGCAGRMGRMLVGAVAASEACTLAGGTEVTGSPHIGADIAALAGVAPEALGPGPHMVTDDAAALFAAADGVVDFTVPEAAAVHAALAASHGVVLVNGTTGFSAADEAALDAAARKTAVVRSANMSVGINLLLALTRQVAGLLGEDYDIEVVEMHHRHKVDAPSGTALALGRAAADGRGVDVEAVSERVRDGHTGPRRPGQIGFATLRGGDVAGDHTVIFATEGERIELGHRASSRAVYARGAIRAALWACGKPPGRYSMLDVLGFGEE